ncbi:unnamed protein product [Arctogadus glacialis]
MALPRFAVMGPVLHTCQASMERYLKLIAPQNFKRTWNTTSFVGPGNVPIVNWKKIKMKQKNMNNTKMILIFRIG